MPVDLIRLQKQFFLDYNAVLEECLHDDGEARYLDLHDVRNEVFEFTNISNFDSVDADDEESVFASVDADDEESISDMTVDNNTDIYELILSNIPADLVALNPQDAIKNHKELYKALLAFSPINPRNPRTYFDLNDLDIGWSADHFKYEVYLQVMDVVEIFLVEDNFLLPRCNIVMKEVPHSSDSNDDNSPRDEDKGCPEETTSDSLHSYHKEILHESIRFGTKIVVLNFFKQLICFYLNIIKIHAQPKPPPQPPPILTETHLLLCQPVLHLSVSLFSFMLYGLIFS